MHLQLACGRYWKSSDESRSLSKNILILTHLVRFWEMGWTENFSAPHCTLFFMYFFELVTLFNHVIFYLFVLSYLWSVTLEVFLINPTFFISFSFISARYTVITMKNNIFSITQCLSMLDLIFFFSFFNSSHHMHNFWQLLLLRNWWVDQIWLYLWNKESIYVCIFPNFCLFTKILFTFFYFIFFNCL